MKTRLHQVLESLAETPLRQLPLMLSFYFMTRPDEKYVSKVMDKVVIPELDKAYRKHPVNMMSLAEAVEITREEFDEFVVEVRRQEIDVDALLKENLHLIAMSLRTLFDVTLPMWARAKGKRDVLDED